MRLKDKVAIVVGAGQSPGEGIGNGRATALTFAREGAKVLCVDHNLGSAEETVDMINEEPGHGGGLQGRRHQGIRHQGHRRRRARALGPHRHPAQQCRRLASRAATPSCSSITEEAFDRCVAINLKSCILACKHVIPIMREQKSGAIVNISSMAVITTYPYVAYKATKAAMVSFTEQLAYQNARVRHPRQRHPARPDEHADGRRHPRARVQEDRAPRSRPSATPRCRCARRWAPAGTSPTPRCSSPPTRPTSSPA